MSMLFRKLTTPSPSSSCCINCHCYIAIRSVMMAAVMFMSMVLFIFIQNSQSYRFINSITKSTRSKSVVTFNSAVTMKQSTLLYAKSIDVDDDDEEDGLRNTKAVQVDVALGDGYKSVSCEFFPIFYNSTFFTVTYPIPFGLNIEKPPKGFPAPIVTKDSGIDGGEMKGDVLRATTSWSQGFSAAGATSDIMMFAGNIKWRKSIFDTAGAPWQQTVDALLSNTAERSETVTLVFERELSGVDGDSQ